MFTKQSAHPLSFLGLKFTYGAHVNRPTEGGGEGGGGRGREKGGEREREKGRDGWMEGGRASDEKNFERSVFSHFQIANENVILT